MKPPMGTPWCSIHDSNPGECFDQHHPEMFVDRSEVKTETVEEVHLRLQQIHANGNTCPKCEKHNEEDYEKI